MITLGQLNNTESRDLILNNKMEFILSRLPIFISRKIISYEEICFEKKYHLKENIIKEEKQKVLKQVPIRYQKQELVEDLKKLKTVLLNQKTSPGYSSVISILLIIIVIGILLITLILCSIGIRG